MRKMVILFLMVFSLSFASDKIPAKVVSIIDGDTIKILIKGKIEKVRLIGIDTPESRFNKRAALQARKNGKSMEEIIKLGKMAKEHLRSYIRRGDTVFLEFDVQKRDRYGRLLAYVWKDHALINKKMVCDGYAYPLTIPPNVKYTDVFRTCFKRAVEDNLGLWSGGKKTESKDFRCGSKRYCYEMKSCQEAMFYLKRCGLKRLDRDRDGIPCEKLCR